MIKDALFLVAISNPTEKKYSIENNIKSSLTKNPQKNVPKNYNKSSAPSLVHEKQDNHKTEKRDLILEVLSTCQLSKQLGIPDERTLLIKIARFIESKPVSDFLFNWYFVILTNI